MKVVVSMDAPQRVLAFDVDATCTLGLLRQLIAVDLQVKDSDQMLAFNGIELVGDDRLLSSFNIKDQDLLYLRIKPSAQQQQQQQQQQQHRPQQAVTAPGQLPDDPEEFRRILLETPGMLEEISLVQPQLAEAARSNPARFAEIFRMIKHHRQQQQEALRLARLAESNPFDLEVQRRIEEEIQQRRIEENMQAAMEHAPETFGQVFMLYISSLINGVPCKVFVDSGAQMTIMSRAFASKCNLDGLIDTRWQGIARGVGSSRIIGRIHMALMTVEGAVLPCSFTVLENNTVDVLFGLDMLRRHQCVIDLQKNVLRIGDIETRFLGEAELPTKDEEAAAEAIEKAEAAQNAPSQPQPQQVQAQPQQLQPQPQTAESLSRLIAQIPAHPGQASSSPAAAAALAAALGAANAIRLPGAPAQPQQAAPQQAPPQSAVQQTAAPAQAASAQFPEATVQSLMALGASREAVLQALAAAGGNADMAASFLF